MKIIQKIREFPLINKIFESRFHIFVLVGIGNTIFAYLLFSFLIFLGLHYTWAVLISTCLGILFNFKTTGGIVFKNKNNRLLLRFVLVYGALYFVNIGLIKLFYSFYPNYYIDGAVASLFLAIASFSLNRLFVFRRLLNEKN